MNFLSHKTFAKLIYLFLNLHYLHPFTCWQSSSSLPLLVHRCVFWHVIPHLWISEIAAQMYVAPPAWSCACMCVLHKQIGDPLVETMGLMQEPVVRTDSVRENLPRSPVFLYV